MVAIFPLNTTFEVLSDDAKRSAKLIDTILFYHPRGRMILAMPWAFLNSGLVWASEKPAMPQPIFVTKNVSSG